VAELISEPSQI